MKVEEFLNARVDDIERIVEGSNILKPIAELLDGVRRMIELHTEWPVMLATPAEFEAKYDPDKPDEMRYALMQKMEWVTRDGYFEKFGKEAPTAPFIRNWLEKYKDHPDFNPNWLS